MRDRTSPTEIIGSGAVIIQLLKVLIIWGQSLSILVLHAMSNTNIQIEDTLENCSQVFFYRCSSIQTTLRGHLLCFRKVFWCPKVQKVIKMMTSKT